MASEAEVREGFRIQHFYCERMDAPIYARLCDAIADHLTEESETGRRVLGWSGEPTLDALPLRLIGGLNALARSGRDPALAAVFAGDTTDPAAIGAAVNGAMTRHDAELLPWLDGPPQTNEAGRSAALMLGLMEIARRHGPRVELLEIGSSAGLNLLIDRYGFDLGGTRMGPADAPVVVRPDWRGPAPDPVALDIVSVRGCDVAPLDATDSAVAERLAAYVWAETPARLARLEGGIAMQRARGVDLVGADAADWIEARLAEPQADGVTRVLMHSVVWQYLPVATASRIRAAMKAAAARATPERPLGWTISEPDRAFGGHVVKVRSWPSHGDWTMLGVAHAHGTWVATDIGSDDLKAGITLPEAAKSTIG